MERQDRRPSNSVLDFKGSFRSTSPLSRMLSIFEGISLKVGIPYQSWGRLVPTTVRERLLNIGGLYSGVFQKLGAPVGDSLNQGFTCSGILGHLVRVGRLEKYGPLKIAHNLSFRLEHVLCPKEFHGGTHKHSLLKVT